MPGDPFDFDDLPITPLRRAVLSAARPILAWLFRLRDYRTLYASAQRVDGEQFCTKALAALDVCARVASSDLATIPPDGPLIVAANHPHGMLDGLVLANVIARRRPDVRVLANYLLARIPELTDTCFFVDPFETAASAIRSQAGLRAAHLWLKRGGTLVIFPAGEVAPDRDAAGSPRDSTWRSTVGRLALATGARVIPAFISGSNSAFFYAAGRMHPALRTLLLPRELLAKRHGAIDVRLGAPLIPPTLRAGHDARALTDAVRNAADRLRTGASRMSSGGASAAAIAREVEALPSAALLVESGALQVFVADRRDIPLLLDEIGRLREITYRAIGEGTGRERDLDEFDATYLHLFACDRIHQRVVGAYRLGRTDRIVGSHGTAGLYTGRLFRYDDRLIRRLSPALELGRSFVRAEYQKNYNALLILWKGIGQFVVRNPQYRTLFGPVSISARYADASHQLLMSFLEQNHRQDDLAALVDAIHPGPSARPAGKLPSSVTDVDRAIAAIEADRKGMPVLLRQYLKLNARLLAFSVDPDFGDALDALMMVDLATVAPAILARYFGRTGAAAFLARHAATRVMPDQERAPLVPISLSA